MRISLVAITLAIDGDVLGSPDAYRRHLEAAADRAVAAAGPATARLIVFPELAGHLALYAHAGPAARRAKTLARALAQAAVRRPLEVLRGVAQARRLDAGHAVLVALAPDGERWWKSVFGPLARRHEAYVVAGSLLHLAPSGELYNASLLFGPEGRLIATTSKVNLVPGMEDAARGGLGLARGNADAVPIVDTPLGRVCTLIGYDAFCAAQSEHERFAEVAPRIAERGRVAICANPAATTRPWRWREDGLPATLAASRFADLAVSAQLVGSVLDLTFDGASEILEVAGGQVRVLGRESATVERTGA